MKFVEPSHFTDPDAAVRKLLEIANATEPAQDGRIYIELVTVPRRYQEGGRQRLDGAARIRDLCEIHP
jgi:hypothetical protein